MFVGLGRGLMTLWVVVLVLVCDVVLTQDDDVPTFDEGDGMSQDDGDAAVYDASPDELWRTDEGNRDWTTIVNQYSNAGGTDEMNQRIEGQTDQMFGGSEIWNNENHQSVMEDMKRDSGQEAFKNTLAQAVSVDDSMNQLLQSGDNSPKPFDMSKFGMTAQTPVPAGVPVVRGARPAAPSMESLNLAKANAGQVYKNAMANQANYMQNFLRAPNLLNEFLGSDTRGGGHHHHHHRHRQRRPVLEVDDSLSGGADLDLIQLPSDGPSSLLVTGLRDTDYLQDTAFLQLSDVPRPLDPLGLNPHARPSMPNYPFNPNGPNSPYTPIDPNTPLDPSIPNFPTTPSGPVNPLEPSVALGPSNPHNPAAPLKATLPLSALQPAAPGGSTTSVTTMFHLMPYLVRTIYQNYHDLHETEQQQLYGTDHFAAKEAKQDENTGPMRTSSNAILPVEEYKTPDDKNELSGGYSDAYYKALQNTKPLKMWWNYKGTTPPPWFTNNPPPTRGHFMRAPVNVPRPPFRTPFNKQMFDPGYWQKKPNPYPMEKHPFVNGQAPGEGSMKCPCPENPTLMCDCNSIEYEASTAPNGPTEPEDKPWEKLEKSFADNILAYPNLEGIIAIMNRGVSFGSQAQSGNQMASKMKGIGDA